MSTSIPNATSHPSTPQRDEGPDNLFTGKAGEYEVASQLLIRYWQVAFPAVDIGHDLVISDGDFVQRVQVKTSRAIEQKRSYVGRFHIPRDQLASPTTPELLYVLAVYRQGQWSDFVVTPRDQLFSEHDLQNVGTTSKTGKGVTFRLRFDNGAVVSGKRDWTRYRRAWPESAARNS